MFQVQVSFVRVLLTSMRAREVLSRLKEPLKTARCMMHNKIISWKTDITGSSFFQVVQI